MKNKDIHEWLLDEGIEPLTTVTTEKGEYYLSDILEKHLTEQLRLFAVSSRFSIWSTECPSCKTGRVLLFEKGGLGKCDNCKRTYFTDYEKHPELGTPQTEYWIVD